MILVLPFMSGIVVCNCELLTSSRLNGFTLSRIRVEHVLIHIRNDLAMSKFILCFADCIADLSTFVSTESESDTDHKLSIPIVIIVNST